MALALGRDGSPTLYSGEGKAHPFIILGIFESLALLPGLYARKTLQTTDFTDGTDEKPRKRRRATAYPRDPCHPWLFSIERRSSPGNDAKDSRVAYNCVQQRTQPSVF
jgi:hypothetical protein